MNLNRAMIIGNLTRDPEMRTTPSGQNVANFGVATNHSWTDASGQKQEKAEFHNIVAWGKLAEICSQYLGKGRKVYIEGRLQSREWEAQDGTKKNRTEIIAENMIMLDRAPAGGQQGGYTTANAAPVAAPVSNGGEEEIRIEDIPF
ncbi:MAG: single-stranded DNA-binding protein [Patescibacteria group bacterium]